MRDGRDRLLKASLELFTEFGFHAVSIRDIADKADLTNPALYQHFSGKLDLGRALYLKCYDRLICALEDELRAEMTPIESLQAYVRAAVRLHAQSPSPLPFLEDHQRLFGIQSVERYGDRAISRRLEAWVEAGQADGSIRTDVPPKFIAGLCIGQLTKWIMMSELGVAPRENAADHLIRLLNAAITPKA